MVPSAKTRDNGHTVKRRRQPLIIRKHLSTVRVTKHWHRLPQEVVEFPSLEILRSYLDTVLHHWAWMVLLEQGDGTR